MISSVLHYQCISSCVYFRECCRKDPWEKYYDDFLEDYYEDQWKYGRRIPPPPPPPPYNQMMRERSARDLEEYNNFQRGMQNQFN